MLRIWRPITRSQPAHYVERYTRPIIESLEHRRLLTAAPPTGLIAMGSSATSIELTWNASSDPAVTGYDVFEKKRVVTGGGKGSRTGHDVYVLLASNLTKPSDTVSGLATGSGHTYVVTALTSDSMSAYSAPATGQTWIAPSLSYGSAIELSSGALFSSPITTTVGLTTQIKLLASGNPLSYSMISGPATASVGQHSGVVTYTPAASEVGLVSMRFKIYNPLGFVKQTVQFDVAAMNPDLPRPKIKFSAMRLTYTGSSQAASAQAFEKDGLTPIAGSFALAYDGGPATPNAVGSYSVLATFTSSNSQYADATATGTLRITKANPEFSRLDSQTIAIGTKSATVTGNIAAGFAVPSGDGVTVTLKGKSQYAPIDSNGNFSAVFHTASLLAGSHTVTYAFAGDQNFLPANGKSKLIVIPTAKPKLTLAPVNDVTTVGDAATFSAAATGSPEPTVQWQVSIDGGKTFSDVPGVIGTEPTLIFTSALSQNGYQYRAVFTNRVGSVTTLPATLTVETDTGGDS